MVVKHSQEISGGNAPQWKKKVSRLGIRSGWVAAGALLMAFAPVSPAMAASTPAEVVSESASLRPGEFVFQPELAPQGAVEIVVSVPLQRAYIYRAGTLIGVTTVSTGRPGHETPIGTFNILEKQREHYSNRYNNAPMPFMQRLTWDGVAMHAGQIPGHPASHGCVRLPLAFARQLFPVTQVGAAVHITEASPAAGEALAMVRGTATAATATAGPEDPVQSPGAGAARGRVVLASAAGGANIGGR